MTGRPTYPLYLCCTALGCWAAGSKTVSTIHTTCRARSFTSNGESNDSASQCCQHDPRLSLHLGRILINTWATSMGQRRTTTPSTVSPSFRESRSMGGICCSSSVPCSLLWPPPRGLRSPLGADPGGLAVRDTCRAASQHLLFPTFLYPDGLDCFCCRTGAAAAHRHRHFSQLYPARPLKHSMFHSCGGAGAAAALVTIVAEDLILRDHSRTLSLMPAAGLDLVPYLVTVVAEDPHVHHLAQLDHILHVADKAVLHGRCSSQTGGSKPGTCAGPRAPGAAQRDPCAS